MARDGSRRSRRPKERQLDLQMPDIQPVRTFGPVDVLSAEQVEDIHQASLRVLRDTGVHFMGAKARQFLATFDGAQVDQEGEIVKFAPEFVEETIKTVPRSFRLHARNSARDLEFGAGKIAFANIVTPPYLEDRERGHRTGSFEDMQELVRLMQGLDAVAMFYGYPVEPQDLDPVTRHLDAYRAHAVYSDKVWRGYSLGEDRIRDAIEIARIARGADQQTNLAEPSMIGNVTTNSPLRIDEPMGDGLMIMAKAMQPTSITCFTMAGAIGPITLAGSLVQQNAEILAAVVLSQLANPGAPLIYGAFASTVHMRSGALAFGNPEFLQLTLAAGQLARRYGMPFKSAGATCSKLPDAQAAYETQLSIWAGILGGADVMVHAAGFLDSALTVNLEKLIIDVEMIQMMAASMKPIDFGAGALATDAIDEVGPGGHFFSTEHTLERYKTAFYEPFLSDWDNRQNWIDKGSKSTEERATEIWKAILKRYEQPPLDPAILDELDAYVARRREEILKQEAA